LKLLPPDKGGDARVGEKREKRGREGQGIKGKGGKEDFREFPQFQICHYATAYKLLYFGDIRT